MVDVDGGLFIYLRAKGQPIWLSKLGSRLRPTESGQAPEDRSLWLVVWANRMSISGQGNAGILVTLPLVWLATQTFAPSNAAACGLMPTEKVPWTAPSLARSLVTLLLPEFAIQMLAPSNTTAAGPLPTAKVP